LLGQKETATACMAGEAFKLSEKEKVFLRSSILRNGKASLDPAIKTTFKLVTLVPANNRKAGSRKIV